MSIQNKGITFVRNSLSKQDRQYHFGSVIKKIKFFRKFSKAMASEYGFHSFPVVD
jgi:hypothetical protein